MIPVPLLVVDGANVACATLYCLVEVNHHSLLVVEWLERVVDESRGILIGSGYRDHGHGTSDALVAGSNGIDLVGGVRLGIVGLGDGALGGSIGHVVLVAVTAPEQYVGFDFGVCLVGLLNQEVIELRT